MLLIRRRTCCVCGPVLRCCRSQQMVWQGRPAKSTCDASLLPNSQDQHLPLHVCLPVQACDGFTVHEQTYFEAPESLGNLKQASANACCSICSTMEDCTIWSYCDGTTGCAALLLVVCRMRCQVKNLTSTNTSTSDTQLTRMGVPALFTRPHLTACRCTAADGTEVSTGSCLLSYSPGKLLPARLT